MLTLQTFSSLPWAVAFKEPEAKVTVDTSTPFMDCTFLATNEPDGNLPTSLAIASLLEPSESTKAAVTIHTDRIRQPCPATSVNSADPVRTYSYSF